jgi:hypothetical protein
MLNMEAQSYYDLDTAAEAQITLSALSGQRWSIGGIAWSYEGGTLSTDAEILIWSVDTTGSSNTIFSVDVNDDGAGFIIPAEPFKFPSNTTIIFELASGGANVVGKLNILGAKAV